MNCCMGKTMPTSTDPWVSKYNDTVRHTRELTEMINEWRSLPTSGSQAQRDLAALRRKFAIIGKKLNDLRSPSEQSLSRKEMNRRRDILDNLRSIVSEMASTLNMSNFLNRNSLLEQEIEHADAISRATGLDNQEILALQTQIMREQDDSLDQLEETVTSITHIAQAVNEELDLHASLLDEMDQHVEVTDSKLRKLLKRMAAKITNLFSCI